MINKLKPKSEFSRNVLTLMTGTTIAQAIPIAISPILTRMYSPEDFGIFALYMSISAILSVLATGGYEHAIMLPKRDSHAKNILILSIFISLIVSFVLLLFVFIFNDEITKSLGNREISNWLYFIPISVLLTGIYQSMNYWNNRKKEYYRLSITKVIQSGSSSSVNLFMGFSNFGSNGLILGSILGQLIASVSLTKMTLKNNSRLFFKINRIKILIFFFRYINFLKFSTFSALLNSLSFNLFTILLGKVFSLSVLGFYSLVFRIITIPSALIGNSISQVYFQESNKARNLNGNNNKLFLSTLKKLFIISSLLYIPMYFFIENLIVFIFGSNWKVSGEIAQILTPLMFIRFVSSIMSSTLTTYEKQKSGLLINLILAFSVIILFLITYIYKLDVYTFFNIYVIIMSILYTLYLFYYYHLSKGKLL